MASKTTVRVDRDVLKLLERIKREESLRSYSEALRTILRENKTLKKSELGSLRSLKPFVRDKHDRFE